jgi:hypothetical protein
LQSFTGGVLLTTDSTITSLNATNDFIANFYCSAGSRTITKQYKTQIGESITGPLTADQQSGVLEAIKAVRPPKTVPLTVNVNGDPSKNTTYTLTGITYVTTTYSIWVITSTGPPSTEQRIGYIVETVPQQPPKVSVESGPCPTNHSTPVVEYGAGFQEDPTAWLTQPIIETFSPPDDGISPIFSYGEVRVLSGGQVYAVSTIRPGENATFILPPGSYDVESDLVIFGIHLTISGGSVQSPPGAVAILLTVTLTTIEEIWYVLEIVVIIIVIVLAYLLLRHFVFGGASSPVTPTEGENSRKESGQDGNATPEGADEGENQASM